MINKVGKLSWELNDFKPKCTFNITQMLWMHAKLLENDKWWIEMNNRQFGLTFYSFAVIFMYWNVKVEDKGQTNGQNWHISHICPNSSYVFHTIIIKIAENVQNSHNKKIIFSQCWIFDSVNFYGGVKWNIQQCGIFYSNQIPYNPDIV